MGTSTYHRSPATPEWERVRELYLQPNPSPGEIVSRVTAALDATTKAGLSDRAVTTCLDTLLEAATITSHRGLGALLQAPAEGLLQPGLQVAGHLRNLADARIAETNTTSLFGELGLAALTVSVLDACGGPDRAADLGPANIEASLGAWEAQERLGDLAINFLGREMEHAYRYFVSRDLSDFVGSDSVPQITDCSRLLSEVGDYCRTTASSIHVPQLHLAITQIMELGMQERISRLQPLYAEAVNASLVALAAGG